MGNTFDSKSSTTASSTSVSTTTASSSAGFTLDGFLSGLGGLLPGQGQATATAQPTPPRIVEGAGKYIYKQDADGTITVLQGPKITEPIVHAPGSPKNVAITAEIGPYVSPIPAAPAPAAGNPLSGLIDTVSGFDPIGAVRDLFGGGETETPATDAPVQQAPAMTNPFTDGTPTLEGSTLDIAKTRLGMATGYKKDAEHGLTDAEREAMRTGDKDAATFFCSGFTEWTLAAAGYDMKEPLRGEDGVAFSYTDGNAKTKPGTEVTLDMLLNGQPEAVTTMAEVERQGLKKGGWVLEITEENKNSGFNEGVEAGEMATKGAAGAFELAGIGTEIAEAAQRPGDFAQSRYRNNGKQNGAGHAWQVYSVKVVGDAWFGQDKSPTPLSGELEGWHTGVEFVIDDSTDPALVGEVTAMSAERIEANVAGANSQKTRNKTEQDSNTNGGVGISGFVDIPATGKEPGWVVFYGRLATSKWNGWKPAKPPADPAQPETTEPSTGGGLLDQARDFFGL